MRATGFAIVLATGLCGCGGGGDAASKPFNAPAQTQASEPAAAEPITHTAGAAEKRPDQVGLATWYGPGFAGKKTASGERFDPHAMTAAHRTLPFGTWVEVRRVDTGSAVRVRITDRGPWHHQKRYIIDLSRAAGEKLGLVEAGAAKVELRVVDGPE